MTEVVRVGLISLIVKEESGSGPSVADSKLEAPSNRPRSREELKCSRMMGRIGSIEAKRKEGSGVEQEERKSLREGVPLDETTGGTVSLVAGSRRVLLALKRVSSGTVIDMSRLDSERVGAEEGTRAVGKTRAVAIMGMIGEKRVEFLRIKNKKKGATEEGDESLTKGVLSYKLVLLKIIKLLVLASRLIWSMIEGLG